MSRRTPTFAIVGALALSACGPKAFPTYSCDDSAAAECFELDPTDPAVDLHEVINGLFDDSTIVLGVGSFDLDNEVASRGVNGLSIIGQGMDETILDFSNQTIQGNGVAVVGDNFLIQDLTVLNAQKDAVRVEDSDGVTMRRVRTTWGTPDSPENGAYGLYPVKVSHVLVEECEAFNASDAGLYVGQCQHAVIRNNIARGNVAGIEIENTQFADVYGNLAEDNTGGLVIFDLPGNPIVGRDIHIHDNRILNNNRPNFAPGGTVAAIPSGTGTFAMASRRLEIANNEYANNNTLDIAVISGLVIEGDPSKWALDKSSIVGDLDGLDLVDAGDQVMNFKTSEIYVHDNTHSGSGSRPDNSDPAVREMGFLLAVLYNGTTVDNVIYDAIGESSFDTADATKNSNDNHICVGASEGSFASLNLEVLAGSGVPSVSKIYRPDAPFAPFNCDALTTGPIRAAEVPGQ
ncbi:MAG: parallel beta-helix repeat protein [Kiritimatiellia bacterium]|jgi:parallel beta-helix repeat protein